MRVKSWVLGGGGLGTPVADAGLLVLRVAIMALLIGLHGVNKLPPAEGFIGFVGQLGFPAPVLFAWLVTVAETLAPALILIGLATRPAALFVVVHFILVVFVAHAGDALADRELAIMFGVVALALMLTGPGRYSLDAAIGGRRAQGYDPV